MRTLSAELLAAQRAKSSKPYLTVLFTDTCAYRRRFRWTSVYSGAEAAGPHCAVLGSDGSLNRFRVAAGILYRQRVVSPAPGSDFSSWTQVATNRGAVAVTRYGATIELYAVRTDGGTPNREVWLYVSADDGASWGAGALAFTAPVAINYLAAGSKSNGTVLVVFDNGAAVRKIKRVAAVWGAQADWTNTAASLTGLACSFSVDFELVVTGTEAVTLEPRVWRCIYGDGYTQALDTWSALMVYARAAAGLGVTFSAPFLRVASGYRFTYREAYTGLGAYDRVMQAMGVSSGSGEFFGSWREPEPFDLTATYGLALAGLASGASGRAWVCTPSRVFCSQVYLVADLSSRLVRCDILDRPYSPEGGWLELDNADGVLNWDKVGVGDLLGLRLGSEVWLGAGYVTTTGGVVSPWPHMWVVGLEYRREKLKSRLVVHLGSTFWLLDRPVLRAEEWAAGSEAVYSLVRAVVAGVGLGFGAYSGSPALTALSPAFSVRPGQSRLSAVVELLGLVEDEVVGESPYIFTVWPQKTDATDYAYGTDHAIRSGVHVEVARPGLARAFGVDAGGGSVFGQALDFPALENFNVGSVRFRRAGGTASEAATVALATLRGDDLGSREDELVIGPNVGEMPYDVVEVTDAALGYAASKRRVRWVRLQYDADRGVYAMRLGLGGL